MSEKEKTKPKYKETHGSEILGTIIFTAVVMILMWVASVYLR